MKALGLEIPDDAVLFAIDKADASKQFTLAQVADWLELAGVSAYCKKAAADNLLRRMKRADLIRLNRYRTWKVLGS